MPAPQRAVTVYCGSSDRVPASYLALAEEVGRAIAARGWGVVFGGGSLGLMGRCADAALAAGGHVTGVITRALAEVEVAHPGLVELHLVDSMHERKEIMSRLGDGFLVLPGGFGTLDEVMEAITWRQLGIHHKPVVFLDHQAYWQPLFAFLRRASAVGFIRPQHLDLVSLAPSPERALDLLVSHPDAPERGEWWRDA